MNFKHGCAAKDGRTAANPKWRLHYIWLGMKTRCDNQNHKSYPDYGGRGISYDPSWSDFSAFLADIGLPPEGMTLERIDNDGPYSKANCRWATRAEQGQNKRNNRYLEFRGERRTVAEWAKHLGVKPRLLRVRLNRGWSVEATLSRAPDPTAGQFKAAA